MIAGEKIICIIPCRMGSKRIPHKNIKKFGGLPLINYTVQAAVKSKIFSNIVISTEMPELVRNNILKGLIGSVNVRMRDTGYDGTTDVQKATAQVIRELQREMPFGHVVMLLPSSPLRGAQDIKRAVNMYIENSCKPLISVSPFIQELYWAFDALGKPFFKGGVEKRSQDAPKFSCPNGGIWISPVERLLDTSTFYAEDTICYSMPYERGIDIDTMDDWRRAEAFYRALYLG